MSKAVLVVNNPKNGCMDCDICLITLFKTICGITGKDVSGNYERGGFPEECPLKQMPEKDNNNYFPDEFQDGYAAGWNACIHAICGEEK